MLDLIVNYYAILAAAIVAVALGFLWYSPVLFGTKWMKLMGMTAESMNSQKGSKNMTVVFALQALGALAQAFVLAYVAVVFGVVDVASAVQLGFWMWLGFVAPTQLGIVLWDKKPWALFYITAGYYLVSLILMSLVLALWQ